MTSPVASSGMSATERHRQNWYDCIRTGATPVMDVETGYRTVSMCILGNLAWSLGRKLTYDMSKERFVDDPAADKLIAAEYRAPWRL